MPELRLAGAEDASALAVLDALASQYPWRPGQFESVLVEGTAAALVAEAEAVMRGFVLYSQVLDEATILNIVVHPGYQGRGLGADLLAAALGQMSAAGARRCMLEVRVSNEFARRLYRSSGFKEDGIRRNYYPAAEGREDAVLMSRRV